jgi:16S rRNA (guanine527-N7)-methyltransferase
VTSSEFGDRLRDRLALVPLDVAASQLAQLERYFELLRKWNGHVNLTSLPLSGYAANTLDRLLVEPLMAASLVADSGLCIDLGSGGGSPAIPMAIARPAMRMVLVESRERKSAFLREVVRELASARAEVLTTRAEQVPSEYSGHADVVSVRALRLGDAVTDAIKRLLKPDGSVLVFGANTRPAGFTLSAERSAVPGFVRRLAVAGQR